MSTKRPRIYEAQDPVTGMTVKRSTDSRTYTNAVFVTVVGTGKRVCYGFNGSRELAEKSAQSLTTETRSRYHGRLPATYRSAAIVEVVLVQPGDGLDRCRHCHAETIPGSTEPALYSYWRNAEGDAVGNSLSAPVAGARWVTICNVCGEDQW